MRKNKCTKIFDWVACINKTKDPISSFDESEWNIFKKDLYILHLTLSQDKDLIELVDYVQGLNIQNPKQIYSVYKEFVPYNNKWNGFIKSKAKTKYDLEIIDALSEFWKVSKREVKEYLELLSEDSILNILNKIGYEKQTGKTSKKSKMGGRIQKTKSTGSGEPKKRGRPRKHT